jgi:RNA polymerase sigma factor (TIGR02999 family)
MNEQLQITSLLKDWKSGDEEAGVALIQTVYGELKKLSSIYLKRSWNKDLSLQTTELVNELYIKLVGNSPLHWQDRAHFFGIAARMCRQVLTEYLRHRKAQKRGSGESLLMLEEHLHISDESSVDFESLNEALQALEKFDERKARLVELRFFAGLTIEETAEVLNISPATIKREWVTAKAWLYRYMKPGKQS